MHTGKNVLAIIFSLFASAPLVAQDSPHQDSRASASVRPNDSLKPVIAIANAVTDRFPERGERDFSMGWGVFSGKTHSYEVALLIPELNDQHPFFNFRSDGDPLVMEERAVGHDEALFYALIGLLFFYGFIKVAFMKYHENLFRIFLRSTLRQQQLSEQLLQSPWPSLLLNALFVFTFGLYASYLCRYFGVVTQYGFWQLMLYFSTGLAVIYSGKYFLLRIFGWTLGMSSLTNGYIFTVFMVNKVAGILLLPVLLLVSFPFLHHGRVLIPISLVFVLLLLFYRFMSSFQQVRSEIRLNIFHFFIYLCGFEIAPLLVSFKVLLIFVEQTS